jgi:hypothetical protein
MHIVRRNVTGKPRACQVELSQIFRGTYHGEELGETLRDKDARQAVKSLTWKDILSGQF